MKVFNKLSKVSGLKKGNEIVEIYKFQKEGTKRVFFAPMYNGKHLNSVKYARLYDAEKLARLFLNR